MSGGRGRERSRGLIRGRQADKLWLAVVLRPRLGHSLLAPSRPGTSRDSKNKNEPGCGPVRRMLRQCAALRVVGTDMGGVNDRGQRGKGREERAGSACEKRLREALGVNAACVRCGRATNGRAQHMRARLRQQGPHGVPRIKQALQTHAWFKIRTYIAASRRRGRCRKFKRKQGFAAGQALAAHPYAAFRQRRGAGSQLADAVNSGCAILACAQE